MEFDDIPPLLVDTSETNNIVESNLPKVPVTILAGYLGSGKSTLLRHLTNTTDRKIAIILNEFGSTSDIEKSITVKNKNEDNIEVEQWIELDNGCMCCTAKDAGVVAIENLMKKTGRFDQIIIECSGVADPAPIANTFWLDDALMAQVKLDSVCTVLDAQTILRTIEEGPLASVQIACADIVIINKKDCVSATQLAEIESLVRDINVAAEIMTCDHGQIPPESILNVGAYENVTLKPIISESHGKSNKNTGISTLVLNLNLATIADLKAVESQLQILLWDKKANGKPIEIHRTKGKLQIADTKSTYIVQGVREVYEIVSTEYEPEGECKLVLIGKNLQDARKDIEEIFMNQLV